MKTTSTFSILDVKQGRNPLLKLVGNHKHRVPVTITGFIVGDWSGDDGVSREFEVAVTGHKLGKPVKYDCKCVRCEARK